MSTLFSKIIDGEIPARFVWSDETCVGFLTIGPITDGHALVVPREEVDHWLDAEDDLLSHLNAVARRIGEAQQAVWEPPRVGLMVAGFEVPHLHVHVWPVYSLEDFGFAGVDDDPDPAALDANAERIRARLREAGHGEHVPKA
ncbi:MAG: HIT family protein [Nocardioidaceae bacterium]